MEENSINKKEVDNEIKINIPIISNQEIENTINTKNLYDKIAKQIYHDREMIILQEFIKKLQKENEKLKNIRYDTLYGIETIHLIPESDLIEINTQKYIIEVEPGKFVDLKQVYQENKKLNEYKENYIPIQKIKDKIEEENLPLVIVGGRRNKRTLEYGIKLGRRQALQELLGSEE